MNEQVPAALAGERVDRAVAFLTGLSRAAVADLVAAGAVRLGGRTVTTRATRVEEGSVLEVDIEAHRPEPALVPETLEIDVVHADEHVVVVDKAAGVVVHPGAGNSRGTLVHGLLARYPDLASVGQPGRPGVVHRLDKGTSGLLVVARTPPAYESLVAQLAARTVDRRYAALVWGHPQPPQGMVDAPVGRARRDPTRMAVSSAGRPARTRYGVRHVFFGPEPAALVECRLETGRTHQIRVHLAAIGHPVVGDRRYGGRRCDVGALRPCLHAERLGFDHPGSGERVVFESPLPSDLAEVVAGFEQE
ncbi:MAG TPA: RluA family pseudouridine synthase [Acidimicrobiales bacterium]|nr:RluA family pseudouridine synthase [Acidimicrobiales bacterium]